MKKKNQEKKKLYLSYTIQWMSLAFLLIQFLFPWSMIAESISTHLILRLLLCVPVIVLIWLQKHQKSPVSARIITTVSLSLISFGPVFLSDKATILMYMVELIIITVALFVFIKKEMGADNGLIWLFEMLYLLFMLVFRLFDYEFIDNFAPYWKVAVIVGALVSIIIFVKRLYDKKSLGGSIGIFFLCALLFTIFFVAISSHINYAFDPAEPVEYTLPIHDIVYERGTGRRTPGHYDLTFIVDGEEVEIRVTRLEQWIHNYTRGDLYTFYLYKGAFSDPFYLSARYSK